METAQRRIIIGGGLAGLSLAWALVERGVSGQTLTVVDDGAPMQGSANPAAIFHPLPGRTMRFRRGQDDAFVRSWRILEGWARDFGGDWYLQGRMIRVLADDDRGRELRRCWEEARGDYPGLVETEEWDSERLAAEFPSLTPQTSALVYTPAAGLDMGGLLEVLQSSLKARGVNLVEGYISDVREDDLLEGADQVVLAVGAGLDNFFGGLDLRRRCGELVLLDPGEAQLPAFIHAGKHIFERSDGLWGLGSTYFDPEELGDRDDDYIVERLKAGVVDILPAVEDAEVVEVWRGIRGVFGSDDMPLVGPVPGQEGLHVFAGFGSKGLLWAPPCAEDFADFLLGDKEALSEHIDTRRMSDDKWTLLP